MICAPGNKANAIMYGRVSRGRQATAWSKPLTDMQRQAFDRMSWGFTVGLGASRSAKGAASMHRPDAMTGNPSRCRGCWRPRQVVPGGPNTRQGHVPGRNVKQAVFAGFVDFLGNVLGNYCSHFGLPSPPDRSSRGPISRLQTG